MKNSELLFTKSIKSEFKTKIAFVPSQNNFCIKSYILKIKQCI